MHPVMCKVTDWPTVYTVYEVSNYHAKCDSSVPEGKGVLRQDSSQKSIKQKLNERVTGCYPIV